MRSKSFVIALLVVVFSAIVYFSQTKADAYVPDEVLIKIDS
jgi:hypothetical protein